MRNLFLVILPLLLAGCATVIPPTFITATRTPIQSVPELVYSANTVSSADMPTIEEYPKSLIVSNEATPVTSVNTVAIIPALKKVVKVVNAIKTAVADEKPVEAPPVEAKALPPVPAPIPSPTGAKIQILGIDLEFWVGNNDSWSTVWKLIVLVLFVYGGLRLINLLIGRGEKLLAT